MHSLLDIQSALQSHDEEVRRKAIQDLKGMPLQKTCTLLLTSMGDESWRVRKEAVEVFVSSDPDERTIDGLLELLRSEDNAGLRNSAAEAVTRLGERATASLIRLVRDSDADVRKFVIDVMGSISAAVFIPPLLSALQDADVNVAAAAAEHLGNLGDAGVVEELIRAIVRNTSDFFRFSALAAIGKLAVPAPVPDEIKQLARQTLLRKAVYECLGSIADESAVALLLDGLSVRQKSSRNAALLALYRVFSRSTPAARQTIESSLQMFKGGDLVPILNDSFDPRDASLSEALVVILDIIGDKRSVDLFLHAFANERLSRVAVKALKHLGSDGIDTLISRYSSVDEDSRTAICTLIGECACRNGSIIIREALCDPMPHVRKAAVTAAGKLRLSDCIPSIVRLLNDTDHDVRNAAVSCLQSMVLIDRSGIQAVANQIGDSNLAEQRKNAAILFAALGEGDRLSLLVKDEDALVREAAVTSIKKLHITEATGTLLIALVDENPDVRIAAAEALGEVGDGDVIIALNHALNDEDSWVQCAALKSIARISPGATIHAIQTVFPHAEGLLMITCLELLEQLGGDQSLELVEQTLDNSDADVVTLALSIIARQAIDRVTRHADRLLSHHNKTVRASCAKAVAQLPTSQACRLLTHALEHEENDQIRIQLQNLLKGFA
ncbi:MAG: HEAT repeat domain-containing protein [Geobacteraceae bacterium]|nr:HEAT repeat domain-containing protein [Geobacteraceae bacterium]